MARAGTLLAALDCTRLASYQPYWVARGHVAGLASRLTAASQAEQAAQAALARQAWQRAIGLTSSPAVRAHLQTRLRDLGD